MAQGICLLPWRACMSKKYKKAPVSYVQNKETKAYKPLRYHSFCPRRALHSPIGNHLATSVNVRRGNGCPPSCPTQEKPFSKLLREDASQSKPTPPYTNWRLSGESFVILIPIKAFEICDCNYNKPQNAHLSTVLFEKQHLFLSVCITKVADANKKGRLHT